MRPTSTWLLALPLSLVLAACSSDSSMSTPKPPAPGTDAGGAADAAEADSGEAADSGAGGADASPADSGSPVDAGRADTGVGLGPVCMQVSGCCAELPAGQQQCLDAVASGDEGMCQQVLGVAQRIGYCLPPDHDAGMAPDTGTSGELCAEYLACCPQLGALQARCETSAMAGDESACLSALELARRLGRCQPMMDAGVMRDAGTSSTADAGSAMDAGTSTTADAG